MSGHRSWQLSELDMTYNEAETRFDLIDAVRREEGL